MPCANSDRQVSLLIWVNMNRTVHCFSFSGLDTLGRFFIVFAKGDNVSFFLIVLLHGKTFLNRSLLYKERICSFGIEYTIFHKGG